MTEVMKTQVTSDPTKGRGLEGPEEESGSSGAFQSRKHMRRAV